MSRAFDGLIAGLRGRPLAEADCEAVFGLANHALLTPALCAAQEESGAIDALSPEPREYLRFMRESNGERNRHLRAQLLEAVAALNRAGLTPILLKGAVPLFTRPDGKLPDRMTSDLDVAIEPADEAAALACLEGLGYVQVDGMRGLGRECDVGLLELRPARAGEPEAPFRVEHEGHAVRIPSPQAMARHWIMHDLLKEGDYWRGRIDLRHLHDLARMSWRGEVDWPALRAAMPERIARNALDTQLVALHRLFGCDVPEAALRRPLARAQHARRIFAVRHPRLGAPLRAGGNVAWGARRALTADDMLRGGPRELVRRTTRLLLGRDIRSKF